MTEPVSLSFEFFPPKSDAMEARLWSCVETLAVLEPSFVSVTYGAGGSTRDRTHRTVARIAGQTRLNAAAHLTCVGATRSEVDEVIDHYAHAGIRHIVALRGDPPEGVAAPYTPHPNGYANAAALTAGIKARGGFEVSVGCYPEKHPQSASLEADLDHLKAKIDAGADRAITQFFFDADTFFAFRDRAVAAGITIPIVPGIMLQSNFAGLQRMADLCGTAVPARIHRAYDGIAAETESALAITAQLVGQLCERLHVGGVNHFHFYTLNKPDLALATCRLLDFGTSQKVA
jgi:methylenetetrahydrofolate reductase (NADPH)